MSGFMIIEDLGMNTEKEISGKVNTARLIIL
jgi:hypothetical protein